VQLQRGHSLSFGKDGAIAFPPRAREARRGGHASGGCFVQTATAGS
jgi:hypothetical protein